MSPDRWRRIEQLFHDARQRAPGQLDAFLDRECADDGDLRREVASLLAQTDCTLLRDGVDAMAAALRVDHTGRRLGSYILGPLVGAGAMGEVYRARDANLGRDVAIKILPDRLARCPERLARSEREARILAALNHSNIGAIYGLEESDGVRGLVLELVDGITLKQKLEGGRALPLDEALTIARQIAAGLEAAHRKGIVHRDLKPANIKVTADGGVKVLDFGLAKIEAAPDAEILGRAVLATGEGMVLGTVAYMSPEQARGLGTDKRTDVWAFGCVLYEMLAGERPFAGDTAADVLGAITRAEPDWTRLPAGTPRRVRDVVRRCLAKDPARRLHDLADARTELEDSDQPEGVESFSHSRRRSSFGLSIAVVTVVAAIGGWVARSTSIDRAPLTPVHVAIPLPGGVSLFNLGRGSSIAVSPDGGRVVYVGVANGRRQLYVRPLVGSDSTPIAGTDNAASPFFSPDGRWIGFVTGTFGTLMKVPSEGGVAEAVVNRQVGGLGAFSVMAGTWTEVNDIVFAVTSPHARGLWRVAASGGTPTRLTTPGDGELFHTWPQALGDAVLYTTWSNTGFEGGRVVIQSLTTGEQTVLARHAAYGRVVGQNAQRAWLVYARPDGLHAAPFDRRTMRLAGGAVPVMQNVAVNLSGGAHFSVADNGLLAYMPGGLDEANKTAVWVGRDGTPSELGAIPGIGFQYRVSPDGKRLARPGAAGSNRDLWIDDLERRVTPTRLTAGRTINSPVWTADGRRVVYSSGVPSGNLFWTAADGSGQEERLTTSANSQAPASVSGDDTTLAYYEAHPTRQMDIWLLPLQPPHVPRLLLGTAFAELNPMISPRGSWVAYESNTSGSFEIYLTPLAGGGRQIPISKGGGYSPLWSRDGRELYYRDVNPTQGGRMMTVSVDTRENEVQIGTPRVLYANPYQGDGDIAPDGRFLLLQATPQEARSRVIQLVVHWFEELQAKTRF